MEQSVAYRRQWEHKEPRGNIKGHMGVEMEGKWTLKECVLWVGIV